MATCLKLFCSGGIFVPAEKVAFDDIFNNLLDTFSDIRSELNLRDLQYGWQFSGRYFVHFP